MLSFFSARPEFPCPRFDSRKKRPREEEEEVSSSSFRFLRSRLVMDADSAAVGPFPPPSPALPPPDGKYVICAHRLLSLFLLRYTGMFVLAPVENLPFRHVLARPAAAHLCLQVWDVCWQQPKPCQAPLAMSSPLAKEGGRKNS